MSAQQDTQATHKETNLLVLRCLGNKGFPSRLCNIRGNSLRGKQEHHLSGASFVWGIIRFPICFSDFHRFSFVFNQFSLAFHSVFLFLQLFSLVFMCFAFVSLGFHRFSVGFRLFSNSFHLFSRLCNLGFAIQGMHSRLCNLGFAIWAMLSRLCNLGYAIQAMQSMLCNLGFAIWAMLSRLCNLGYAIQAMQSRLCNLMFWKHLGVFWEHLGVFWGHFGGKRGRHTSAGWPPGGRRMASISLGVLLGSLCLASSSRRQVRTPSSKACLGNDEQMPKSCHWRVQMPNLDISLFQ